MANGDFQNKLASFMRGRNGVDETATASIWLAVILVIINIFARTTVLTILVLALLVYAIWRMTSTNVAARRRENDAVAQHMGPLRPWLADPNAAMQENKAYRHIRCPHCGQRVRIPRGKGHIRVTCPTCREKFETRS